MQVKTTRIARSWSVFDRTLSPWSRVLETSSQGAGHDVKGIFIEGFTAILSQGNRGPSLTG